MKRLGNIDLFKDDFLWKFRVGRLKFFIVIFGFYLCENLKIFF